MAVQDEDVTTPANNSFSSGFSAPSPAPAPDPKYDALSGWGGTASTPSSSQEDNDPNKWSFHQSPASFVLPVSSTLGDETYRLVREEFTEIFKENSNRAHKKLEIAVVDFDRTHAPNLTYGVIVVGIRLKERAELGMAYHALLLEGTGEPLDDLKVTNQNFNGKITRVASEAIDARLVTTLHERMANEFPGTKLIFTEVTVVPRAFDAKEKINIQRLAYQATLACTQELIRIDPNTKPINLGTLRNDSNLILKVALDNNPRTITDLVGIPIRADWQVSLISRKGKEQRPDAVQKPNARDDEKVVTDVVGFVHPVWNPIQNNNWNQMDRPGPYQVQAVIAHISCGHYYSLESILLAIASVASGLTNQSTWLNCFKPRATMRDELDLRDAGALNLDANMLNDPSGHGQIVPLKDPKYTADEVMRYFRSIFQKEISIAIDYIEGGSNSWFLAPIRMAALGKEAGTNAVLAAADRLTNGRIRNHFDPKKDKIFSNAPSECHHIGNWPDKKGVTRDSRDIDLTAIANIGGPKNPGIIRMWSDTWLNSSLPQAQRVAEREQMKRSATDDKLTITHRAYRDVFGGTFIKALVQAVRDANPNITVDNFTAGSQLGMQRAVAGWSQSAGVGLDTTFTSGSVSGWGNNNGNQYNGQGYFGNTDRNW